MPRLRQARQLIPDGGCVGFQEVTGHARILVPDRCSDLFQPGVMYKDGVRPVNGIFKAKEGFGKMDRGAVLSCLPTSSHTTTPSSDGSQMRPGGRAPWPRASLREDRLGAQGWSGLCGIARLAHCAPAVRQQFFDPPRGMGADSIEHIAEVSLRIDLELLARHAQAH
jgi:hypothetical protein